MRKLLLIFNRDFSQWVNELLRDQIVLNIPKIWGRGLEDQIIRYTGRSGEWYRYEDDYRALGNFVTSLPLTHTIFSEEAHERYRKEVVQLRALIAERPKSTEMFARWQNIKNTINSFYPLYTLCVFLPGPWRERFAAAHGRAAEPIIERLMESRHQSEGVVKVADTVLREWVGPMLKAADNSPGNFKLLSVAELESFIGNGILPDAKMLAERAAGYLYIEGIIIPTADFDAFLKARGLAVDAPTEVQDTAELRGMVACKGGIIRGTIQSIFNNNEVARFEQGRILLTPMTQPEFVPAMKKASAIITDEGGLTCHAAITSREFGIPCVIGTKIATKTFKDGDTVEVDAREGIVRKIY